MNQQSETAISKDSLKAFLKHVKCDFRGAAFFGDLDALQSAKENDIEGWKDYVLEDAVVGGQLEVITWVYEVYTVKPDNYNAAKLIELALTHDHNKIALFLMTQHDAKFDRSNWNRICQIAVKTRDFDVLQLMKDRRWGWTSDLTAAAARACRLDILQWLRADAVQCPWDYSLVRSAIARGSIPTFDWIMSHADAQLNEAIVRDKSNIFTPAAANGHIEMLQHLQSQLGSSCITREVNNAAAGNCQLEVLKWLHSLGPDHLSDTETFSAALHAHRDPRQEEVVEWLESQGCPFDPTLVKDQRGRCLPSYIHKYIY
jgi:hypothetical protein